MEGRALRSMVEMARSVLEKGLEPSPLLDKGWCARKRKVASLVAEAIFPSAQNLSDNIRFWKRRG